MNHNERGIQNSLADLESVDGVSNLSLFNRQMPMVTKIINNNLKHQFEAGSAVPSVLNEQM